jgi:hypothetical protein
MKEAWDGFLEGNSLDTVEEFRLTKFEGMLLCGVLARAPKQRMYLLTKRQFTSSHCCVPSNNESDQTFMFSALACAARLANHFRKLWLSGAECES